MESSLHQQLKARYGPERGGLAEVRLLDHQARVDAVAHDGELIEVQAAGLGALRAKLARLLGAGHRVRVIKPVVIAKHIIKPTRVHACATLTRLSPKRGALVDVFDDFVGLARLFPAPGLVVEVAAVTIDEVRVPRRRRPGFAVVDRRLRDVLQTVTLRDAADLWRLLPDDLDWTESFTTLDLATRLGRPIPFAQRVAYCLRLSGAAVATGKTGNRLIYRRPEWSRPTPGPPPPATSRRSLATRPRS